MHAYSSSLIAVCYLALPLAALFYARRRRLQIVSIVSLIAVITAVVSFTTAIAGYIKDGGLTVRASGYSQQTQMLIIGLWLLATFIYLATNQEKAMPNQPVPSPQKTGAANGNTAS